MAHILGMVIAMVAQLQATKQVTSECSWYFVVFSVDTTLGVVLVITMHNSCVRLAKQQLHKDCSGMSEWSSSDDDDCEESSWSSFLGGMVCRVDVALWGVVKCWGFLTEE